ncbi:MAG: electron transfer flavoprotein subunit alpha/FixB family protein [Bacteroidota bacterium]|nr:electron transfer flavoprotein subunit alpha/FixB family protein [Bacteroidota bacterium]
MSILVYIDIANGKIKKATHEVISYGADLAAVTGHTLIGVAIGNCQDSLEELGSYGLKEIVHLGKEMERNAPSEADALAITALAIERKVKTLLFAHTLSGKLLAPLTATKLKAGIVSGVISQPELGNGFCVKRAVFSGKAFAKIAIKTDVRVLTINPNSYPVKQVAGVATVSTAALTTPPSRIRTIKAENTAGALSLTEAGIVVSAGRGLKGPENWGMVEELAGQLNAALACSRPVADAHWRPHHEHVGQTGVAIAPNLYVAIGISGAIQHLAGVNRSKVIVVINKDPEAPFFKAADYGIVGDAFEVVPKFTAALKKVKAS